MNYLKKYKHLASLTAIILGVLVLCLAHVLLVSAGLGIIALWQLAQFARSKRCGVCFNTVLTPEQIKEFGDILKDLGPFNAELKTFLPGLKELAATEGGIAGFKTLPATIKLLKGDLETLQKENGKLRKRVTAGNSILKANGQVTDDCARYLGILAGAVGVKRGQVTGAAADMLDSMSKEFLGSEIRTALSSSDIPLPTEYSGQVVELVGIYGAARRYGQVMPLGAGTVKLPKLSTDPTFGLITQSNTVTEKSPQTAWVTFTPEKFGGMIRVPTELDEDSIVPIGQFIARYAARNIARAEDTNFFVGTGADSGINGAVAGLTFSTITNSKVTQLSSTKTSYDKSALADFRALRSVPDASAIRMGAYYLHPSMEQQLSTFNTSGDKPYNPNAQLQNPNSAQPFINGPTLDGFPIRWVDVMPAYSKSANVSTVFALFGDLSFQYLGVRGGVRFDTSLEAGFTTDEILIRALERFTIGLMANGAVAGLETAAS